MERATIREEQEDTMSKFLGDFDREIAHPVDRSSHIDLEDIYHYAMKIEEQLIEEKEHSKRGEAKGKFLVAQRMGDETSITKKNEASKKIDQANMSLAQLAPVCIPGQEVEIEFPVLDRLPQSAEAPLWIASMCFELGIESVVL
ncbi:geranylgeranyl transferase type-2 subunit alpha 1 [Cucumis melo var. makuwa]|uniref:Geranylgeranyl transferase type-2 subunit alpha 1 n=1 Tax=Cucumis melo var. makuwa TaxID=1194695 RepID=A0A5A7SPV1_CUCMM|nr:geranylgeranyl transferase type-2 subunit alpha 1 [Cucumis melo var. makuwa]TYJ98803.1 geranylgeranyl transferase type-2 subunit alpha 1 [Cucumis melo var. makuwa]